MPYFSTDTVLTPHLQVKYDHYEKSADFFRPVYLRRIQFVSVFGQALDWPG